MHIRESDTSFNNADYDEDLIGEADEVLGKFMKASDLDALNRNYPECGVVSTTLLGRTNAQVVDRQ